MRFFVFAQYNLSFADFSCIFVLQKPNLSLFYLYKGEKHHLKSRFCSLKIKGKNLKNFSKLHLVKFGNKIYQFSFIVP